MRFIAPGAVNRAAPEVRMLHPDLGAGGLPQIVQWLLVTAALSALACLRFV